MRSENLMRLPRHRCGLSLTELVGSLLALAGGTLIGLVYLGVDLQKAGQQLLGQSEATVSHSNNAGTPETANNQPAEVDQTAAQDHAAPQGPTEVEVQQATSDYWTALSQCVLEEYQGRFKQVTGGGPQQRQDYLTLRAQGHLAAVEAISYLEGTEVDPRLVEHGEQLATWHQAAAELFENAGDLLPTGTPSSGQNPLTENWRQTSIQLQKEEQLLMNRHQAMATYLNHQYPESAPFTPARD